MSQEHENDDEISAARVDLMYALEEWKSAGAHVSTVMVALEDYIKALVARIKA